MTISTFDDLLRSAREQSQAQRLLFVFTAAGVPDDATPEQRARFEAGEGGTLEPQMCVDKRPDELGSFEALCKESHLAGPAWQLVFVAALSGQAGMAPSVAQAEEALQRMVEAIKSGRIDAFIAFDTTGQAVRFG